jgi:hypothetical protein
VGSGEHCHQDRTYSLIGPTRIQLSGFHISAQRKARQGDLLDKRAGQGGLSVPEANGILLQEYYCCHHCYEYQHER